MLVVGLDISTHTGMAVLDEEDGHLELSEVFHVPLRDEYREDRFERWKQYQRRLAAMCVRFSGRGLRLVVIEAYSFGSYGSAVTGQVELGALLRSELWERDIPWVEVPPSTLKKFVTGHGAAKKSQVIAAVSRRWGVNCEDDNEADAYGLAQFGLHLLGVQVGTRVPKKILDATVGRFRGLSAVRQLLM